MSYKFCDKQPCEGLKKALPLFLERNWRSVNRKEKLKFQMVEQVGKRHITVYLVYCPFCGTRLIDNDEIMESVAESFGMNPVMKLVE